MFPYSGSATLGIQINWMCDPVGGDPCGCCEYYFAHWYSSSRTCGCNHSNIPTCQSGSCYEHYSVTLSFGL